MIKISALAFVCLLTASHAQAWSNHHLVTKAALSQILELGDEKVKPTSFDELLKKLGYSSAREFNQMLIIKKNYVFAPKLGEKPGVPVRAIDILTKYSDEPDWGMDRELFGPDQYPQLWKDEYGMMGGRTGGSSQGFRHMYWRGMSFRNPIITFKLPIGKIFSPMGHAPQRALDFVRLARQAFAKGERYWGLRFIANALHYLEDVTQPFHSVQTPSKEFVVMPFKDEMGSGMNQFVLQVQHIVEYYHYAFEDYIGRIMKSHYEGPGHPDGAALVGFLAGTGQETSELPAALIDIKEMTEKVADLATRRGGRTGRVAIEFFPKIGVPFVSLNTDTYMNEEWWKGVMAQGNSSEKEAYLEIVKEMFVTVGDGIRRVVMWEAMAKTATASSW